MKKLKVDAAPFEEVVKRCEYDITHAGAHLPEQGAAIGEEHAQRSSDRLSSCERRSTIVSVNIRERQIIQTMHDRRVERAFRGAVDSEPFAAFVIINCIETARIGEQAETHHSNDDCEY